MIFTPEHTIIKEGQCFFGTQVTAKGHDCLNKDVLKQLWHGSTYRVSQLTIKPTEKLIFTIGTAEAIDSKDSLYTINVTETGICIAADTEKGLIKGYITLLDQIKAIDLEEGQTILAVDCCEIKDSPQIVNQMAHYCIFPDTELWELHKFLRLCGMLKYSHVVLEFWGMIQYDVLKELSWNHAFTKEQIRPLIQEANDMGMEIIPMFNHWGHAAASRVMHGKHVVLDQNPRLQTLFNEDGWTWNINNPKTRKLLKCIRQELIELCGEGSYFHLGCDEAYNFKIDKGNAHMLTDFLNEIAEELMQQGRRAIMWGDMLVAKRPEYDPKNRYTASCKDIETEQHLLQLLDHRIIIADWQYDVQKAPVETALVFQKAGLDVILCPWDRSLACIEAHTATVKESKLYGIMHTTWHTLSSGTPMVTKSAVLSWKNEDASGRHMANCSAKTAALLRKAYFVDGDYTKAGWAKYEIGVNT